VIGDRPQGEDVEVLSQIVFREGFRRHVGFAGVFDELIDVRRRRDAGGRRALAIADLPVEDLDPRATGDVGD